MAILEEKRKSIESSVTEKSEKKKQARKHIGSEKFIYNISLNLNNNNNLQNSLSGSSNSGVLNETNFKGSFVNNVSNITSKRVDSFSAMKSNDNTSVPKKYSSVMKSNIILKKGENKISNNNNSAITKRFIKSQIFMEGFKTMIKSNNKGRQSDKGVGLEQTGSENIAHLASTKSSSIASMSSSLINPLTKKTSSSKAIPKVEAIIVQSAPKEANITTKPFKLEELKHSKNPNKGAAETNKVKNAIKSSQININKQSLNTTTKSSKNNNQFQSKQKPTASNDITKKFKK